jgi:hypothetical protein
MRCCRWVVCGELRASRRDVRMGERLRAHVRCAATALYSRSGDTTAAARTEPRDTACGSPPFGSRSLARTSVRTSGLVRRQAAPSPAPQGRRDAAAIGAEPAGSLRRPPCGPRRRTSLPVAATSVGRLAQPRGSAACLRPPSHDRDTPRRGIGDVSRPERKQGGDPLPLRLRPTSSRAMKPPDAQLQPHAAPTQLCPNAAAWRRASAAH